MASWTTQRNGPTFSRPRRATVLLAALLVVALGTGAVWWQLPAPPPPAQAADSIAAEAGEPQATTGEVAPREVPARSEAATPRTAVVGRALDAGGGPLTGFRVTLQRTDPMPVRTRSLKLQLEEGQRNGYPPGSAEIDAAGGYAFEALDAGNYRCVVRDQEQYVETFALAAGEVRELTLQSRFVALTLSFFRRGEVMKDCLVQFSDGKTNQTLFPCEPGVMRLFAAPGRYEIVVRPAPGAHHRIHEGPYLSRHVLLVPDGATALQWYFETGGTQIAFAVEDPLGNAIDKYTVDIEGTGTLGQEPGHYVLQGTRAAPAAMPAMPEGQWRARVTSDVFRVDPRDFVTGIDDGRVVLSFVAQPAGTVRLKLRPRSPFFAIPEAGLMPLLVADGCAVPCKCAGGSTARGRFTVFAYDAVPPGKATLCFQDRIEGDELVLLPFEPIEPVTIDVAIGSANEVAVDVVPRACVDLRGCEASGMEMAGAVLTVWVDGRRARNRDAKTSQRWLGWLPRGEHRVVIDRNGTCREHVLRVDRPVVRERYRP